MKKIQCLFKSARNRFLPKHHPRNTFSNNLAKGIAEVLNYILPQYVNVQQVVNEAVQKAIKENDANAIQQAITGIIKNELKDILTEEECAWESKRVTMELFYALYETTLHSTKSKKATAKLFQ